MAVTEAKISSFVDQTPGEAPVRGMLHRAEGPSGDFLVLTHGASGNMNTALLVSRALGLRNPEDFDADDSIVDARPWVGGAVRDSQDRLWRKLTVRPLLADAHFLDATLETHV